MIGGRRMILDFFQKKRQKANLMKHLKYLQKEMAESTYSPASAKELTCILADYFGGTVAIYRAAGTIQLLASSSLEPDEELEEHLQRMYADSGRNLTTMDKRMTVATFFKKRKIFWKMVQTYNADFGILVVSNLRKRCLFPDEINDSLCLYLKAYNIVQKNNQLIYYENMIPSKEALIKKAEEGNVSYWCMVKFFQGDECKDAVADEIRGRCLKYLRTLISSDELYYYQKDVLTILYHSAAADLTDFVESIIDLLDDRCGQPVGIVAIPYDGSYKETFMIAECQLIDLDPFEMRIIPEHSSVTDYMPKARGNVQIAVQHPQVKKNSSEYDDFEYCDVSDESPHEEDVFDPEEDQEEEAKEVPWMGKCPEQADGFEYEAKDEPESDNSSLIVSESEEGEDAEAFKPDESNPCLSEGTDESEDGNKEADISDKAVAKNRETVDFDTGKKADVVDVLKIDEKDDTDAEEDEQAHRRNDESEQAFFL